MVRTPRTGYLARIGSSDGGGEADQGWTVGAARFEAGEAMVRVRQGDVVAVADLRFDNREALRSALGRGAAAGDGDLLLAAYARWGEALVDHLDGPFSFVVWDGAAQRGVAARDALGRRPLFLARTGRGVALSNALPLLHPLVAATLRPEAVRDYLRGDVEPLRRTFLEGVVRVPAAHVVSLGGGRATERRYWAIDPEATLAAGDDACAAAFREAFDRAVGVRLGGEPGAFLSGGLDSSSIVATARHLRPDAPLPTFSIVYRERAADERRYVDAVAAHVGVEPVRIDGDALSLLAGLDGDLGAYGEPFFTPNLFLTRTLYEAAAGRGLGAVLDGFAGDNVVGHGDRRLTELAYGLRWPTFVREATAVARRTRRPRATALGLVRDYVWGPLRDRLRPPPAPLDFARPELGGEGPPRPRAPWTDRRALFADLSSATIPRALEVAVAVARAHGVDPRFPFVDRRLVELSLSLPSSQRLQDGLSRSVLRRAMGDRLPPELRVRTGKARLGGTFSNALFDRDPDLLRRIVEEDVPAASDVLDVPAVQRAYALAVRDPAARDEVALPFWRAVALARWLATTPRRPTLP